jgi:hypothetical protein
MTKAISNQPSALKVSIDFMAKYGNKDTVKRATAELAAMESALKAARKLAPFVYEQDMEGETAWERAVLTLIAELAKLDALK